MGKAQKVWCVVDRDTGSVLSAHCLQAAVLVVRRQWGNAPVVVRRATLVFDAPRRKAKRRGR